MIPIYFLLSDLPEKARSKISGCGALAVVLRGPKIFESTSRTRKYTKRGGL
jgi:hypothetical protein